MIKYFFIFVVAAGILACTSEAEKRKQKVDLEWQKYQLALDMGDQKAAVNFVYHIIALDSNNYTYYDTLSKLYYEMEDYSSALLAAEKSMQFSLNQNTLEIAYNCVKGKGEDQRILEYGIMLLSFAPDSIQILYEMAFYEVRAYRYDQAKSYLDQLILHPNSLSTYYKEYRGNGVQEVTYRAAGYNLLGFIHNELGEKKIAQDMFKSALNYQADYILAQENLTMLEKELNPGNADI